MGNCIDLFSWSINHPQAIQLMFFTDVVAYDTDIAEADQEKLRNDGWKLINVINK